MAKFNRMEGLKFKYFNHHTYAKHGVRVTTKADKYEKYPQFYPDGSLDSLTVPGQSITVKDLNERYEKGRPVPVE